MESTALPDAALPLLLSYLDDHALAAARAVNSSWKSAFDAEGPLDSPFFRRLTLVREKLPLLRGRQFTVEFLGAFQTGKSTLFRQLSLFAGDGAARTSTMPTRRHVRATLFDAVSALIDGCDTLNIAIMDEGALQAFEAVSMHGDPDLDVASGRFLWRLWRDPGVRSCWDQWEANPHLLREVSPQVDANTPMLMSQCRDTIFHDEPPAASSGGAEQAPRGLDPSTALLSYVHTGDAPQVCLRWPRSMAAGKALEVKLKDYGLSHSTALSGDDGAPLDVVCFVAALSDFDCPPQLGLGVRSRLVEALNTFEDCCEHMVREGLDAPLLVVLNKIDLFARWIVQPGRTLDSAWPEYTGGADASAATAFVRLQFENVHARCRPAARPLRIVCCNALDRESVADKLWPELVDMLPIDPAAVASAATRGEDQEGGDQRIAPGRAQSTTSLRLPRMRSRSTSSSSGRPSSAGGSSLMSSMRAAMGRMGM